MLYTFCKYGSYINGAYRCILISWSVEAIYKIFLEIIIFLKKDSFSGYYLSMAKPAEVIWMVATDLNYLIFIMVIFRLKALSIYMDVNNDKPDQIKA